jgi:hypothetical protein
MVTVPVLHAGPSPPWPGQAQGASVVGVAEAESAIVLPSLGWPTPETTGIIGAGLTYDDLTPSGSITTSSNGQTIEELDITGRVEIIHDNVTLRRCRIRYSSNYGIYVHSGAPQNILVEDCEVDQSLASESLNNTPTAIYNEGGEVTFNRLHMHNTLQGLVCVNTTTIVDSLLLNERAENNPNAHREPCLAKGQNLTFDHTVFWALADSGVSAALAIYNDTIDTDFVHVHGCLIFPDDEDTGGPHAGYSAYFGSSHDTGHPPATNVDILDNWIGIGRSGYYTAYDGNQSGSSFVNNRIFVQDGSSPHGQLL